MLRILGWILIAGVLPAVCEETLSERGVSGEVESVLITSLAGLALYFITFLATEAMFLWWLSERGGLRECRLTIEVFFFAFLFAFLGLRMFWMVVRVFDNASDAEFVLNRLANLCFLTVFTSVLFAWIEYIHSNKVSSDRQYLRFLTGASRAYLLLNAVIYAFQFVVIGLLVTESPQQRVHDPLFFVNTVVMEALFAVLAVAFLIYGLGMLQLFRAAGGEQGRDASARLCRTLLATLGFTVCFLERVFVFTWQPLTGAVIGPALFVALGYLLPELVPCWIGLLIFSHYGFRPSHQDLMEALYADSEPSARPERSVNNAFTADDEPLDEPHSPQLRCDSVHIMEKSPSQLSIVEPLSEYSSAAFSPTPLDEHRSLLAQALGGYHVSRHSAPITVAVDASPPPPPRPSLLERLSAQYPSAVPRPPVDCNDGDVR